MPNYFVLSIRFLDAVPSFHGRGDGSEPEWPPSPLRMFQALVCAAAGRWREQSLHDYAVTALRSLEGQTPIIIAPAVHAHRTPYRMYVPNNAGDLVSAAWARGSSEASMAQHRVEKDVRPTRLIDDNAVHYLYPLPDGTCPHLETLVAAARSITHLGWGVDMVAADASIITKDAAAELTGERWRAVSTGGTPLRVPQSGTLDALIAKHQAFLNRLGPDGFHPVPPLSAFRVVGYRRDQDSVGRPYAAFRLLHPETGKNQTYAATDPVKVAGMIRCAAGKLAIQSRPDKKAWIDEFVYGHHNGSESFGRFSYLPLPSIQPVVGVGRIGRVLIAEPLGAAGKEITWIKRLLAGQLALNKQGCPAFLLVPLTGDHVLNQYVKPSDSWTTVTPVALPGSDDGMASKTDKLLGKMFRHAGYSLDMLADWPEYHRVPFWRGAEDAKRYRPRAPHYLANCTMYHMRIRWKVPISGPLALGSGRHCGLGVFAATPE